jgi:isoleucyl-tRNA synthetase
VVIYAPIELSDDLAAIARDELNVKLVKVKVAKQRQAPELNTKLTPELRREGLARDLIRQIQALRKQSGLEVDDRISLVVETSGTAAEAVKEFEELIKTETLAVELLTNTSPNANMRESKIDGTLLRISLSKV